MGYANQNSLKADWCGIMLAIYLNNHARINGQQHDQCPVSVKISPIKINYNFQGLPLVSMSCYCLLEQLGLFNNTEIYIMKVPNVFPSSNHSCKPGNYVI